jgi:nitroimidazol reductase NimA-like FMN-containing flavoprotein (pyridoxamine 5'-phosphate oxidase superfamily)
MTSSLWPPEADPPHDVVGGLEVLDRDECLRLLATTPVARIGITLGALPVILPVNIAVDEGVDGLPPSVVIRTGPGMKLDAARAGDVVALEADLIDPVSHAGWSVLVQGRTTVPRDQATMARLRALPLSPWARPDAQDVIVVATDIVTGRRLVPWRRAPDDAAR